MPTDKKPPKAPDVNASVHDHKKHADKILADEKYKKKPDNYQDKNDEAKP